ncbi:hypothetical protein DFH09DRAFT_1186187 [Mycena vulgaris]|nr:hypothetical protein DFH09DRAFT_1186187 [Mycena vulgaris]
MSSAIYYNHSSCIVATNRIAYEPHLGARPRCALRTECTSAGIDGEVWSATKPQSPNARNSLILNAQELRALEDAAERATFRRFGSAACHVLDTDASPSRPFPSTVDAARLYGPPGIGAFPVPPPFPARFLGLTYNFLEPTVPLRQVLHFTCFRIIHLPARHVPSRRRSRRAMRGQFAVMAVQRAPRTVPHAARAKPPAHSSTGARAAYCPCVPQHEDGCGAAQRRWSCGERAGREVGDSVRRANARVRSGKGRRLQWMMSRQRISHNYHHYFKQ